MDTVHLTDALRRRYPAIGQGHMPGPWTVLEQFDDIDLVAFCAWRNAPQAQKAGVPPIVGHELKVSRSDCRRELLNPGKRQRYVSRCTEFYLVTPQGLLTQEEKRFEEPDYFDDSAFRRTRCPAGCRALRYRRSHGFIVADDHGRQIWELCRTCGGSGYVGKSMVELEAPTLWVPRDIGLIEVNGRGCVVAKRAPVSKPVEQWPLGRLVRWASVRSDPRHERAA
jgi:hypothetical protein